MSLPGTRISADDLYDLAVTWPTRRVDEVRGRIMRFVTDEVTTPDGHTMVREYLEHPGGVSVIALDEDDNVAVVTQYRHPVGFRDVEPPAGLLDVAGEDYLLAVQRELAEEAELAASDWRILADVFSSPGGSSESLRVYLARGLKRVPRPDGFVLGGEEAHMQLHWATPERPGRRHLRGTAAEPDVDHRRPGPSHGHARRPDGPAPSDVRPLARAPGTSSSLSRHRSLAG